jgi:hypothetical protein
VAGGETTALPGNLPLPIIFNTSLVAVSTVNAEIQALEIGQVLIKSFALEVKMKRLILKWRKDG